MIFDVSIGHHGTNLVNPRAASTIFDMSIGHHGTNSVNPRTASMIFDSLMIIMEPI